MTPEELQSMTKAQTLLRRMPILAEVANVATFVASDRASAMTGTVANVSAGSIAE